ncbi:Conserved secreted protein [Caenorhabditis elegans]|uniref:Conserved secreted protein n=1 Tax=Caenorhabditis elegans TaxID=6239 RepID=Q9XUP9_CAEEL|nr:Conserved secreted protein [Caenorhabditis elegans]CAB04726.1 Conserved secreted protein [Caenorhabditis elegans]|eukprot:NP_001256468.1 Uncharacterized protein CELE_T16G1.2 [Caenorhabditis elegans]
MNLLQVLLSSFLLAVESQVAPIVHPALLEGPQNEVVPSLIFPSNRVGSKNRLRSRVFRDASSQGYKGLVDSPRLFRASGRFHKRVQSATTHDIQNVPLPQETLQIVSYKYDAEKHDEKKMSDNDVITNEEAEDHARGIERTTMSIKPREGEITEPMTTTTQMPEHNSINEIRENSIQPVRPKTFFQTVTANGSNAPPNQNAQLPLQPQPPLVFTPQPPIAPPTFTMPSLVPQTIQQLPSSLPQQGITRQQPPPAFPQASQMGLNPVGMPHQPSNPLVASNFNQPQQPVTLTPLGTNPTPTIGGLQQPNSLNSGGLPQQQQSALSPNHNEEKHDTPEQLGCGWDWLTNSCKDVFALNWCGKCHDFGNIFLHDCKCIAPLIPLPTTVRPSQPPPPHPVQQRHPLFFWLI